MSACILSRSMLIMLLVAGGGLVLAKSPAANTEVQRESQHQEQHREQQGNNQQQTVHPVLVERKYWLGDTEFGKRDNWRSREKPCTLLERINIIEQSVISMGDSMDDIGHLLESNIGDLTLAESGILLLEEDSPIDSIDPMFIKYLNESGDCVEFSDEHNHLFEFGLDDDQKSWFNPDNWISSLDESGAVDWSPESHRIPCGEDVAVFGDRRYDLFPTIESNEREKSLSFKVNFKPSAFTRDLLLDANHQNQDNTTTTATSPVGNLRVSRLIIAGQKYNQEEFMKLVGSDIYKQLLFQFNEDTYDGQAVGATGDQLPLDSQAAGGVGNSLLTIDESSVHADIEPEVCRDEAGCLCGNEDANVMKLVCSFHEPLSPEDHPCHDPIESPGYCNKICASSLTIVMDPSKFSERFLINHMDKLVESAEDQTISENVFTGTRRTHVNRYEITFRNIPGQSTEDLSFDGTRERRLAILVQESLEKDAIKSYYGIKSMSIKSSVSWRRGNRDLVFWATLMLTLPLAVIIYAQNEGFIQKIELHQYILSRLLSRQQQDRQQTGGFNVGQDESFVRFSEPRIATDDNDLINQEIQLLELEGNCSGESINEEQQL